MVGKYTDEERLRRGQYKVDGQWYTSSGYKIRNAFEGTDSLSGSYGAYNTALQREADAAAEKQASSSAGSAALRLLRRQKEQAALDAENAARQAYVSNLLALRTLEQELTASGSSGGMTDSAYLRLLANYENLRGSILAQRDKTVSEYDEKIAEKQAELIADAASGEQSGSAARTGITSAAKTGTKTGTKKTTSKSSTTKSAVTLSDMKNAYVQTKTDEITNALMAGRYNQAQARALKNLLKIGRG